MRNDEIATGNENQQEQNIATQIFHEFKFNHRVVTIGLLILLGINAILWFANDEKWRNLFESYDFISQDGEGINNANYGEQGDITNGAENQVEEGQVER